MAAQVLRKGQAIVWVPPRSIGERAFATEPVLLAMLPVSVSDKVGGGANPGGVPVTVFGSASSARYVRVSLDAMPALRTVTLIFDARDVNLLQAEVPPLSGARLQQALPNVVEDLLLQDPHSCAFTLGPRTDGENRRLVAAIDRGWLEFVLGAFERRGAQPERRVWGDGDDADRSSARLEQRTHGVQVYRRPCTYADHHDTRRDFLG